MCRKLFYKWESAPCKQCVTDGHTAGALWKVYYQKPPFNSIDFDNRAQSMGTVRYEDVFPLMEYELCEQPPLNADGLPIPCEDARTETISGPRAKIMHIYLFLPCPFAIAFGKTADHPQSWAFSDDKSLWEGLDGKAWKQSAAKRHPGVFTTSGPNEAIMRVNSPHVLTYRGSVEPRYLEK